MARTPAVVEAFSVTSATYALRSGGSLLRVPDPVAAYGLSCVMAGDVLDRPPVAVGIGEVHKVAPVLHIHIAAVPSVAAGRGMAKA